MNFILGVVFSVAIVTAVGIVINQLVLDRVVGAEPLIGLLSTAGLLLVIDSFALAFFGSASISVDDPVSASIEIFGTFYPVYRLVVAGIAIAAKSPACSASCASRVRTSGCVPFRNPATCR